MLISLVPTGLPGCETKPELSSALRSACFPSPGSDLYLEILGILWAVVMPYFSLYAEWRPSVVKPGWHSASTNPVELSEDRVPAFFTPWCPKPSCDASQPSLSVSKEPMTSPAGVPGP